MKRFVLFVALFTMAISAKAQTSQQITLSSSQKDSIILEYASKIAKMEEYQHPRFKLYKTENRFNQIELDTATGKLWLVQYGIDDELKRMKVVIDDTSLLEDDDILHAGRYELYPTSNTFNFILLDTEWGTTYQVQWSIEPEYRFRILISY